MGRAVTYRQHSVGCQCLAGVSLNCRRNRLTRAATERRFGDDDGVPESVKCLEHAREDFDPSMFSNSDADEAGTTDTDTDSDDG